jgi:hypothetical protein
MVDHVGAEARDTAAAEIGGVALPTVAIPGLPLRLEAGRGTLGLSFALEGDRVRGAWRVRAPAVTWARDSAAPRGSDVQQLVERVLAGIGDIDLEARLGGSLAEPALAVRSNLDDVLAQRLRAVLGEEVAAVETRLRARVDSAVGTQVTAVSAQVASLTDEATRRLGVEKTQLDAARQALEQQLRQLTRGLPGIRIP